MADAKWKLAFRDDQVKFIIAALKHVSAECVEQERATNNRVAKFTALRTKERSDELIVYIEQVTS